MVKSEYLYERRRFINGWKIFLFLIPIPFSIFDRGWLFCTKWGGQMKPETLEKNVRAYDKEQEEREKNNEQD